MRGADVPVRVIELYRVYADPSVVASCDMRRQMPFAVMSTQTARPDTLQRVGHSATSPQKR